MHGPRSRRSDPAPARWRPKWHRGVMGLIGVALLVGNGGPVVAADADAEPEPIFAAIGEAVARGRVDQGPILGFDNRQRRFNELPREGALLVGFDVGIGKFLDIETVYALRPIYLTSRGLISTRPHGLFARQKRVGNRVFQGKVLRQVRIKAPPGYAVGAMIIRAGLNINGLALTYMRIGDRGLDPWQAASSPWVGDRTGGSESTTGGDGRAIVGLYGSEDEEHVSALGPLLASPSAPAVATAAAPTPSAPTPVEEAEGEEADAPREARRELPRHEAIHRIPVRPVSSPPAFANWLPIAAGGAVAVPVLLLCFLGSFNRKAGGGRPERRPLEDDLDEELPQPRPDVLAARADLGVDPPEGSSENPPVPPEEQAKAVQEFLDKTWPTRNPQDEELPRRFGMIAAMLGGAVFSAMAPHYFPTVAGQGINMERAMCAGVAAMIAGAIGTAIGKVVVAVRS